MAGFYLLITLFIIITNITQLPGVFERIFSEAFGFRQVAAGGFGAVLMNGIKRGLFSNEAGSGSAPCAAAAAVQIMPVKVGLTQALGVFIDTLMICSCTAMIMLLTPTKLIEGLVEWIYYKSNGISSRLIRSNIHCHNVMVIQFFYIYRNLVLCTLQRSLPLWR